MNYSPLSAVVALAAMAGTAVAGPADAPAAEPPIIIEAAPSAYDWSGFYAGGSVGLGQGDMDFAVTTGGEGRERSSFGGDAEGGFGAVRFGYDMMTPSGWVFGGFVDLGFGDLTGSAANRDGDDHDHEESSGATTVNLLTEDEGSHGGSGPPASMDFEYSNLSMVALRAGRTFGPQGRGLFYALAGLGMADISINGAGNEGPFRNLSASDDINGAVYGVGAEYALRDNLSLFAEYNFFNFSESYALRGTPGEGGNCQGQCNGPSLNVDVNAVHVVRLGVNFQF